MDQHTPRATRHAAGSVGLLNRSTALKMPVLTSDTALDSASCNVMWLVEAIVSCSSVYGRVETPRHSSASPSRSAQV